MDNITAIRLLPMSESDPEFTNNTIEDLQKWFGEVLPYRDGFNFKTDMITPLGTLVLFQYKNSVIASAILVAKIINTKRTDGGYKGAFLFDPSTIAIFNPIHKEEMKKIWKDFKTFSQSTQKLDLSKRSKLQTLLEKKSLQYVLNHYLEEDAYQNTVEKINIDSPHLINDVPEHKIEANESEYINRWRRNPIKAKNVIVQSEYLCEYDATHLFFTSHRTQKNYVEAHHLIPMEFQESFNYSLDVEANIVSLCPLCHKKIHHATLDEKSPMIEKLYNERKNRLEKCEINIDLDELLALYEK